MVVVVREHAVSPANIYVAPFIILYTYIIFKATHFYLPGRLTTAVDRYPWFYVRTVYSACVSQSGEQGLHGSITSPVVVMPTSCACVYYCRCNCFAVKPHHSGSHISSLVVCEQTISVGVL